MDLEEVEQARGVIRAVGVALSAAVEAGPPPPGLEAMLDAARRAVPKMADPHPCIERCWRVGGGVELVDGVCPECGSRGVFADCDDFGELCTPEAFISLCLAVTGMREVLEHPAVLAAAYSSRDLK